MAKNKKRKNFKQVARTKPFLMALGTFVIVGCIEFAVLQETKITTDVFLITVIITMPFSCAFISYLEFKSIHIEEEKYKTDAEYVQHQMEKKEFVQVENLSEESGKSFLTEKVDIVAVQSKEEDVVIVAMSHNDDIISMRELPKEQFEENYNIIKEES